MQLWETDQMSAQVFFLALVIAVDKKNPKTIIFIID